MEAWRPTRSPSARAQPTGPASALEASAIERSSCVRGKCDVVPTNAARACRCAATPTELSGPGVSLDDGRPAGHRRGRGVCRELPDRPEPNLWQPMDDLA